MKKQMKKLMLAKETLRNLSRPELRGVAGATHQQTNCSDCGNDTTQTSGTCGSGFCGSISCDGFCAIETSNGLDACVCVGSLKGC
jgi:hypothetical protein